VIVLQGTVIARPGDTFHMRLDAGEEIWVKPTPVEVAEGVEIGKYLEVFGDWSCGLEDDVRLFSAREINRIKRKSAS
jgi:hypothetical protein